ncbi:MAG: 50S ribosomal protein L21 [Anaerolineaceae bacterium]|nr:50S ribosomal protein L21 [Anaerolineaceae bacterium]
MKYAIVEAGGKQYRAEEGKTITVDLLPAKSGEKVTLDKVLLLVDGDSVTVGTPTIKGASLVTKVVVEMLKGEKIFIFKYKPKINYRRRAGHRQKYTMLMVESIKSAQAEKTEK